MREDVCERCGTANPQGTQFCRACDAYLGWDRGATTIGGHPVAATVPEPVEAVATEVSLPPLRAAEQQDGVRLTAADVTAATTVGGSAAPSPTTSAPAGTGPEPVVPDPPTPRVVEVPSVQPAAAEATLTPGVPVTVPLRVFNGSSVVDGFVVQPADVPGWLSVRHPPVRLMPRDEGVLELVVELQEGVLVFAQRLAARFLVTSESDPTKSTEVALTITVPPHGPAASLDVQPRLLRLTDQSRDRFVVRIDNRQANYAQTFELTGSDPEGVVRFGFLPNVVQAPPGQLVEVRAHFVAPAPAPGRELTRQLTVTASNDEGESSAGLTLVQHTSPEPEDVRVVLRLTPRELRVTNAVAADFEVHVDNRGGHRDVELSLGGSDPARALTVAVSPSRLVAPPGQVTVARGRVQLVEEVPRGQTVVRPFSVVASDGVTDVEAPGSLEVTVTASPLSTADLRVAPRQLTLADTRRGTFDVVVDNTQGREPLTVWLSAADSHGMAAFTFAPPSLTVPPRGTARSRMVVDSPRPPGGESVTRELEVSASDGDGRLLAQASFTQVSSDRQPLLRVLLVLTGAALVVLGTLLPWNLLFFEGGLAVMGRFPLGAVVDAVGNQGALGDSEIIAIVAATVRPVLLVLAAAMAFGLTGSGSLTRKAAFLVAVVSVVYVVAALTATTAVFTLSAGLLAVWTGAVLGYVGGVLARRDG